MRSAGILTVALLALIACGDSKGEAGSSGPVETSGGVVAQSAQARLSADNSPPPDRESLASSNAEFAFDLYHELREDDENLFFSPWSISVAFGMAYAGAEAETERQIADVMHFDLPAPELHAAFNAADLELNERTDPQSGITLRIVNALWGQMGHEFLESYLDLLAGNYAAGGIRIVNFKTAPDASRREINSWVADQTLDRIAELIPQGAITIDTRMVLTNAVYFEAGWQLPFDEDRTTDADFYGVEGTATVRMMRQTSKLEYGVGEGWQAVRLPYQGGKLVMVAILPEGDLAELEAGFDATTLEEVQRSLELHITTVEMPRMSYGSDFSLKGTLLGMGMRDAFTRIVADFSGIDGMRGPKGLYIDDALHQANIDVTESGTIAAAATAVIGAVITSIHPIPPPPAEITFNRPFLFAIVDEPTGAIVFLGRVTDPSAF